jgi:hypothetical protein
MLSDSTAINWSLGQTPFISTANFVVYIFHYKDQTTNIYNCESSHVDISLFSFEASGNVLFARHDLKFSFPHAQHCSEFALT